MVLSWYSYATNGGMVKNKTYMWRLRNFKNSAQIWQKLARLWIFGLKFCSILLVGLICFTFNVPRADDRGVALDRLLAGMEFDFVSWEINASAQKLAHELTLPQLNMTDTEQTAFVRDYLRRLGEYEQLEYQINAAYTDPAIPDAAAATREARARRDAIRQELNTRQNLAEAILQEQVESALRDEGFAVGGQVLPPVRFRLTELPDVVIISRRDKIERIDQRELTTGLTVDTFDRIEREIDQRFNVSSMVTPIGGLGAYPTMLPETSSLDYIARVAAHEWTHNYLLATFAPVAMNYDTDPASRVINETTAALVEQDISPRVLARFYAQPRSELEHEPPSSATGGGDEQTAFDFNAEMRQTRLTADALLAEGKIEQAERYMNERRAVFVQNGYPIRKLNQAYFAFYGAYNATPGGAPAAGKDPIGPAVQLLRKQSGGAGAFLRAVQSLKDFADLQKRVEDFVY